MSVLNFRNYSSESFEFSPHINLITGLNGGGKSNLLEGIYFSSLGHSPYTYKDKELIKWNQDSFVVTITGQSEGKTYTQSAQLDTKGQKQVRLNGVPGKKFSELLGKFPLVLFYLEDIALVQGIPAVRRHFMNVVLSQIDVNYLNYLRRYQTALKQKNVLLKQFLRYSTDVLKVLNIQLVQNGLKLVEFRLKKIDEIRKHAQYYYDFISEGQELLNIEYVSRWKNMSESQILEYLEQNQQKEIELKMSLSGPHRDNLLLLLNNKIASDFASQGQKRLIALSLKLASSVLLKQELNQTPAFLLDDVFAELDENRRLKLSQVMSKKHQIFLASSRKEDIPFKVDQIIMIENGVCQCH